MYLSLSSMVVFWKNKRVLSPSGFEHRALRVLSQRPNQYTMKSLLISRAIYVRDNITPTNSRALSSKMWLVLGYISPLSSLLIFKAIAKIV